MGLVKDRAIILGTRPFGESDKIVRMFTLSSGRVTGIIKGGQASVKRFGGVLQPFNTIEVEYMERAGNSMVRIDSAHVVETGSGIDRTMKRICTGGFLVELVEHCSVEKQGNQAMFGILFSAVERIKKVDPTYSVLVYYQLRLLNTLGYLPNLESCVICNRNIEEDERLFFSKENGGLTCRESCGTTSYTEYPPGCLAWLDALSTVEEPMQSNEFERLGMNIVFNFITTHLDLESKSLKLLKTAMNS